MSDAVERSPLKNNGQVSAADDAGAGRLTVVSMADVEPERVQWLWPGRIPLGKLSVIAGIQGLGKSFLTLDMASRISNGTPWPDAMDDYNPQGNVILLSAEDALADRFGVQSSVQSGKFAPLGDRKPPWYYRQVTSPGSSAG